MKIFTALQIGSYHLNHCEDFLFTGEIGNDILVCAVMDGCTMGTDSYFAATLVGKILNKIVVEKSYRGLYGIDQDISIENYQKSILEAVFRELTVVKNQLVLDEKELLTTLILLVIHKPTQSGTIIVIGDGLVSIDGKITDFDQDNKPDYLGFHLAENFEEWYAAQDQKISFNNTRDLSIATDGIFMFAPTRPTDSITIDPPHFLLQDTSKSEQEDMLDLKLKALEHVYYLVPTDDLAVVRLMF